VCVKVQYWKLYIGLCMEEAVHGSVYGSCAVVVSWTCCQRVVIWLVRLVWRNPTMAVTPVACWREPSTMLSQRPTRWLV